MCLFLEVWTLMSQQGRTDEDSLKVHREDEKHATVAKGKVA